MSDCSKEQTTHAVVITETEEIDSWEAYPSVICVGKGDAVAFFIKSHLTSNIKVTVSANIEGFFSSADLSTQRNNVLITTVTGKEQSSATISVKSASNPKSEALMLPLLKVKVRR